MDNNRRLDYFIVWGHGIDYLHEMVGLIGEDEDLDVLCVKKKNINDLEKFISDIYAKEWPSVPKEHTFAKTRFLYYVPKVVAIILVMNRNPKVRTQDNKNPLFRMPESETIKNVKNKIRERYDPNKGGRGQTQVVPRYNPDQHVVHASDFPEQVQNALDVFEIQNVEHWMQYWKDKHFPEQTVINDKKVVVCDINNIYLRIMDYNRNLIVSEIEQSPHYQYLCGSKEAYKLYWKIYCGDILKENHSPSSFKRLASNFRYLQSPFLNSYIQVEKHGERFYSANGDHRLAIMKYLGHKFIQVEVI
jgi:hypothetical protein